MMILVFDIGNSNIEMGISDRKTVLKSWRYETLVNKTADEYYSSMKDAIGNHQIEGAIISSVVPILTSAIKKMIVNHLNIEPLILGQNLKTGVELKANNPKEVGADIVAATVATYIKYHKSAIVVDLGTANKVIYVSNNKLMGVIITPGVKTSIRALVNNTALLPNVEMTVPKKVLNNNTIECMQSGITYGVAASIDGLIERCRNEIKEDIILIATGGLSSLIIPLCKDKYIIDKTLILDALIYIYNKNIID